MKQQKPIAELAPPGKLLPASGTTHNAVNMESYSNHLAAIVESSDDAIISKSLDGTIRSWNRAGEKMFGYTAEQAIGKNISLIIPAEFLSHEAYILSRIRSNETVEHYEAVRNKKNGERFFVSVSVSPLKDRAGNIIGVSKIARDISGQKHAAQEIKILNYQLEKRAAELLLLNNELVFQNAEKEKRAAELFVANEQLVFQSLEKEQRAIELDIAISDLNFSAAQYQEVNKELESFSYSVSHDLRAPLRGVHGYAQMLVDNYAARLDSEGNRLVNKIMNNAKKMGQLIDDLLSFSRTGRKELKKVSVGMFDMVSNICGELTGELPARKIAFDIRPMPHAFADVITIRQVWINLISNAIKYSGLKEQAIIEIGATTTAGKTIFYIKDNGAGFDMRYVGKLFGVFQRLHAEEEFEGTGVGLALVQRIVLKHGGTVWAAAEVNKGAVFYFTLQS